VRAGSVDRCEQARGGGIRDAPSHCALLAKAPLGKVRAGGVVAHGLAKHERGKWGGPTQQARGGGEFGDASWPPTQTQRGWSRWLATTPPEKVRPGGHGRARP